MLFSRNHPLRSSDRSGRQGPKRGASDLSNKDVNTAGSERFSNTGFRQVREFHFDGATASVDRNVEIA